MVDKYDVMLEDLNATKNTLIDVVTGILERGENLAQLEEKSSSLADAALRMNPPPNIIVKLIRYMVSLNWTEIITIVACCGAFERD